MCQASPRSPDDHLQPGVWLTQGHHPLQGLRARLPAADSLHYLAVSLGARSSLSTPTPHLHFFHDHFFFFFLFAKPRKPLLLRLFHFHFHFFQVPFTPAPPSSYFHPTPFHLLPSTTKNHNGSQGTHAWRCHFNTSGGTSFTSPNLDSDLRSPLHTTTAPHHHDRRGRISPLHLLLVKPPFPPQSS